jgi:hypothetical protein
VLITSCVAPFCWAAGQNPTISAELHVNFAHVSPGPPGHLHTQAGCPTPFVCATAPGGIFWSPLRSGQPSSWLRRRNFPANAGTDKYHYTEHAFRQASAFALCGLVAKNKGYPSDLTDAQSELIEPLVPTPQGGWPSGDAFAAPDRGLGQ